MIVTVTDLYDGVTPETSPITITVIEGTATTGGGGGAVDSVNGHVGVVVLDSTDVGADPAGTATAAVATHAGLSDPHPGYLTHSEGNAAYDPLGAASTAQAAAIAAAATDATTKANAAQAASQPLDSDLTALAALSTTSYGRSLLEASNAAALRTLVGLVLGTDIYSKSAVDAGFQPLDSDLTAIAALTTTSTGRSLLAAADAAALRTILGLGTAALISSTAGGDLSGTLPSPTVAKINGVAVTGTPSVGYVPTATSSSAATWQAAAGGSAPVNIDDLTTFNTAHGSTGTDYEMNGHGTSLPSGLTGRNLGTSTTIEDDGALAVNIPSTAGDNVRAVVASLTGTTWQAFLKLGIAPRPGTAVSNYGLVIRDSTSGKLLSFAIAQTDGLALYKWTNETTYSATQTTGSWPGTYICPSYWRIRKNSATSYDFMHSFDGAAWRVQFNYDVSLWLSAPDQVGFYVNYTSAADAIACHWMRFRT